MKTFKKISMLFAATIVSAALFSACGGDDKELSPADVVKAKLISATWKVSSVTVDGTNQSSVYDGLKLSFTSTGFTSIDGEPVWPSSGSWEFTSDEAEAIRRNDGLVVEIVSITESQLKLGLSWDESTIGSGRTSSVSGSHVFTFGK